MHIKIEQRFPFVIVLCLLGTIILYHFAYIFPFTNNAFVVANVRPIAANVKGHITHLYVTNEQYVKKGQPLFTVFRKPYQFAYEKAKHDVAAAKAQLVVLKTQVAKTAHELQSQKERYEKLKFDYEHYKSALQDHAVSQIVVNSSLKDRNAAFNALQALEKALELDKQKLVVEERKIKSLIATMNIAKVSLDQTTVYARVNGIVQNMFTSVGAPLKQHTPIFSFVDIDNLFIQANFNETDLRWVRPGSKVSIFPRMYFGSKIYHGVVTSINWAASRQITNERTQQQIVTNSENNWFLLPQRLPVQIKITDYDPKHYPLSIGSTAYVYIHT